jgi:hypothetical protein
VSGSQRNNLRKWWLSWAAVRVLDAKRKEYEVLAKAIGVAIARKIARGYYRR